MSQFESFDNLLAAMQDSVLKAHELIETQHLAVMKKYFDDSGKPKMISLQIPNTKENTATDSKNMNIDAASTTNNKTNHYEEIQIPTYALVPQYSLKLQQIKMAFDVKMVSWEDRPARGKTRSILTNILYSSSDKQEANDVHVELSFVSEDPPEGVMKINDMLIRILP